MNDLIGLLGPGILLAAPILYAALGGIFTQRAGIFNIGLEGFMLLSAYFSVAAASATGSLLVGTLAGVAAAALTAAVMGVIVVGFKADEVIVGIAVNVFALGLTTFLLSNAQASESRLELAAGYPQLHLSWLDDVPVLNQVFNNRDVLVWALIPAVLAVSYVLRRTSFGLRLKAAGEAPLAARAAGVRVAGVRFASVVISGVLCGIAGAQLAIGSVHLFSENMTSGRGIIAFAAVIFGAGLVSRTTVACLLFGFAQALAGLLQIRTDFPPQFVLMVPFILTILAVTLSDALRGRRVRRPAEEVTAEDVLVAESAGIVVAGHLTIDEIRLPDGQTLPATTGGAAGYAALGAFLAQGDAAIVARVGSDYPLARLELQHLDGGRVHTDSVRVLPGRSIHNVAWYAADGARVFDIESFDVLVAQTPQPEDLADLKLEGRWVLVAPTTLEQQRHLVEELKARGARVALDTELHYLTVPDALERLRDLTRLSDCFLPSIEHIRHLFGAGTPDDPASLQAAVASFDCPLTVVKCGRDGVVVYDSGAPQGATVPAVSDLEVSDPTGAGDSFNGGFLVGLARGERAVAAAVTGCVAASFVVQSVGVEVPTVFSSLERASRYRLLSRIETPSLEREELVQDQS
ncbi:PfkB family carbohydrate kinase [Streptosporangium sp. NPDC087985]|uniref:PfkB family carbohydrate kinase n=1 Tax=Streptosporangium sp. NPDC087985 TaxID=3366196 RepID=UPI003821DFFD